jgi:Fe-S cluster assembly iron-binding protein IscA
MITVTERAKQELKRIFTDREGDPQGGLRLLVSSPGEFGLSTDMEMSGDQVVEYEGVKVLLVEKGLADSLDGITLDIENTLEGPKLVVVRK